MTISELGSLGELIGSVAILATLVYLAIQTRLARSESAAADARNYGASIRELQLILVSDESLTEAHMKATRAFGGLGVFAEMPVLQEAGLSDVQQFKLQMYYWALLQHYWTQYRSMDPRKRSDLDAGIAMNFGDGFGRAFWEADASARMAALSPEFGARVGALIAAQ